MRLIDLLNELEQTGTLGKLYKCGAATLAVYAQREVFNTYAALLATPHYADRRTKAVEATATQCRVSKGTVWRAIRQMQREV